MWTIARSFRIMVISSILIVLIVSSGCIRNFEDESHLSITAMDISAESIRTSYMVINVTTYVENHGGSSGNTSILLKAFNTETDLLEMQRLDEIDIIGKEKTISIPLTLELPKKDGYRIIATIFEDDEKKSSGKVTLYNLDKLQADVMDIGIEIEEMDFIVREVDGGQVMIQNDIYLTNEGRDTSADYQVLIKAREMDTRLIVDKIWTHTGKIEPETTIIQTVELAVPDQHNYVVEVIVWRNDTIVKRGEDHVQLRPEMIMNEDTHIDTKNIETSIFVQEEEDMSRDYYDKATSDEMAMPGFGVLLTMVSILSLTIILRRRMK